MHLSSERTAVWLSRRTQRSVTSRPVHQIQPTATGRGEVALVSGMAGRPSSYLGDLVGAVVVRYRVDSKTAGRVCTHPYNVSTYLSLMTLALRCIKPFDMLRTMSRSGAVR